MNALSLYTTTCRMILKADINNAGAWNDINRLIMYLRQSLTCIVCGQLLKVPMSSSVASCQHHVCKSCVGGKMRLKPSCSVCKDYSKFIENIQLRILLQCYKRLAVYLKKSKIPKKWGNLQMGNTSGILIASANSIYNQNQCPSNFKDLIEEGANLEDTYRYTFFEPPSLKNLNKSTNANSSTKNNSTSIENSKFVQLNVRTINKILDKDDPTNKSGQATIVQLTPSTIIGNRSINSINHSSNHQLNLNRNTLNQSSNSTASSFTVTPTKSKHKVRKGCRCGLATLNPGKLTCCGQRCPCYVEGKPCVDCKCRGCRNPNKSNNNSNNSNNLIAIKTSPTYINTSPSINSNQIITTNTTNLLSPSSPNLQLNSLNQATLISSTSTRNLLSPSFLLSSSSTINTPSSSTSLISNNNSMFSTSGNKVVSISSAPPSTAILLGHNNVDSLILPFPNIENIEDQEILSEENVIEEDPSLHHQISDIITG